MDLLHISISTPKKQKFQLRLGCYQLFTSPKTLSNLQIGTNVYLDGRDSDDLIGVLGVIEEIALVQLQIIAHIHLHPSVG